MAWVCAVFRVSLPSCPSPSHVRHSSRDRQTAQYSRWHTARCINPSILWKIACVSEAEREMSLTDRSLTPVIFHILSISTNGSLMERQFLDAGRNVASYGRSAFSRIFTWSYDSYWVSGDVGTAICYLWDNQVI